MQLNALCLFLIARQALSFAPRSPKTAKSWACEMFSGIVEDVGTVRAFGKKEEMELWDGSLGEGYELQVHSEVGMKDAELGCSIAINGVCLTVTEMDDELAVLTFGLSPETLRVSNLHSLEPQSRVNLERALPVDSRNSGHFVQGHVDNCGLIVKAWEEGDSLWVKIAAPENLMRYIVPKGFVAVDGTSLTVVETAPAAKANDMKARDEPAEGIGVYGTRRIPDGYGWFTLMLVAYTQSKVTLPSKAVESNTDAQSEVNIEVDVLAKYVERGLQGVLDRLEQLEKQVQTIATNE